MNFIFLQIIDKEMSKKVKEWISVTKVGRLFEEEKEEAVKEAEAKTIVDFVEKKIKQYGSVEKACKDLEVSVEKYNRCKELLAKTNE